MMKTLSIEDFDKNHKYEVLKKEYNDYNFYEIKDAENGIVITQLRGKENGFLKKETQFYIRKPSYLAVKYFHENGNPSFEYMLKTMTPELYDSELRKEYFENNKGVPLKCKESLIDGSFITYHENGTIKSEVSYIDGEIIQDSYKEYSLDINI